MLQPDSGMQLLEGSVEDGASLYCRLNRSNDIEGKAGSAVYKYQLAEQSYHLLVATGQFSSRPSYHGAGMALPSAEKVDMTRSEYLFVFFGFENTGLRSIMVKSLFSNAG